MALGEEAPFRPFEALEVLPVLQEVDELGALAGLQEDDGAREGPPAAEGAGQVPLGGAQGVQVHQESRRAALHRKLGLESEFEGLQIRD